MGNVLGEAMRTAKAVDAGQPGTAVRGAEAVSPLPDETTILNFRHLLEINNLGQGVLDEINAYLESQGLRLREGTIVDATIIQAPASTKNRAGERDPKMHQADKGNHSGTSACRRTSGWTPIRT